MSLIDRMVFYTPRKIDFFSKTFLGILGASILISRGLISLVDDYYVLSTRESLFLFFFSCDRGKYCLSDWKSVSALSKTYVYAGSHSLFYYFGSGIEAYCLAGYHAP